MERIGVRELRQHASRYLDAVKSGKTIEVTERGKLVALLTPPEPARTARERLVADGRMTPASGKLTFPTRVVSERSTQAVLDELRDER